MELINNWEGKQRHRSLAETGILPINADRNSTERENNGQECIGTGNCTNRDGHLSVDLSQGSRRRSMGDTVEEASEKSVRRWASGEYSLN